MKYEESSVLELKEQINADFKKEIIAFANTDGGEIYVGVARDGSVTGVENPEAEMEKIGNMIRDGIKPDLTAYTSIERIEENGKPLIRVSVSRGLKRPYHLTLPPLWQAPPRNLHSQCVPPPQDTHILPALSDKSLHVFQTQDFPPSLP